MDKTTRRPRLRASSSLDQRAHQRERRRRQAALAAASAGGLTSLAMVLIGHPVPSTPTRAAAVHSSPAAVSASPVIRSHRSEA